MNRTEKIAKLSQMISDLSAIEGDFHASETATRDIVAAAGKAVAAVKALVEATPEEQPA